MDFLPLAWGSMGYSDTGGPGMPVIFLHGSGCDSDDWGDIPRQLGPACRAVAIDFRGHGYSAAPTDSFALEDLGADVTALAAYLCLRPFAIVGHSLGGMVAMAVASRCDAVTGLVLLEGWSCLTAAGAFAPGRFYGALSAVAVARIQDKASATRARIGPKLWQQFWESVQAFDGRPFLARTRVPVSEVYGEMGRLAETQARLDTPPNPCITTVWLPDAGHYLPQERPHDVATIIRQTALQPEPVQKGQQRHSRTRHSQPVASASSSM